MNTSAADRPGDAPGQVRTPPSRPGAWLCAVLGLIWWIGAAALRAEASLWLVLMGLLAAGALIWFARGLAGLDADAVRAGLAERRGPLAIAVGTALLVVVLAAVFDPTVIPAVVTMGAGLLADQVARAVAVPSYGATGRLLVAIGAIGVIIGAVTDRSEIVLAVVGMLGAVAWWAVPTSALLQQYAARRSGSRSFHLDADDEVDGPEKRPRRR